MTDGYVIVSLMLMTIGMIALGMIFNKVMGINPEKAKELRDKAMNLQERMKTAQMMGDGQQMMQLQQESMQLTKQMMKKQLVPTCIRCVIFLVIFAILGVVYADFASGLLPFPILIFGDGWVALYFLFSIGFALLIWGTKKLYKKVIGKEDKGKTREILNILSPMSDGFQTYRPSASPSIDNKSEEVNRTDSWKDKIKNQ
ncbi:MAG: EMC3/TMCO1 family protein [Candidatus Hodarchaeota archaeon]